jgi:Protein of unknown function (DUF1488)
MTSISKVLIFATAQTVLDRLNHILWFRAHDGSRLVRCGVTRDALLKLAGKSLMDDGLRCVYDANLPRIRAVAERKYRERGLERDGVILVGHADL